MEEKLSNTKIIIIGEPSVGKTSFRRSFIGEKFRKNYIETIGSDFSFHTIKLNDDLNIGYSIWDLAGQEKFKKIHPLFVKGAYGAIAVYSVVDRRTFETIEEWVNSFIKLSNREELPIMVIGNKIDLLKNSPPDFVKLEEQERLVEKLRNKYPDHEFISFRTSAMNNENVETGFRALGFAIYDWFQNRSDTKHRINLKDDIGNNIPGAYALVMNQILGPQIVAISPPVDTDGDEMIKISNSGVKLIASLDFDDVISQSSITSTFPWAYPKGIFHYVVFVLDNTAARGNNELFIIGFNANRDLDEPLSGLRGVVNGFLHNSLNEFARLIIENDKDLVTKKFMHEDHTDFIPKVEKILFDLRLKVHESIKKWYNIPD